VTKDNFKNPILSLWYSQTLLSHNYQRLWNPDLW